MAKFMAVHTFSTPISREEANYLGRKVREKVTADTYWVSSWVQLDNEGKITQIICEWNAKDAKSTFDLLAGSGVNIPLDGVYPMAIVDAGTFE